MRLDQMVVERALCESRTEAQELISAGLVLVDGVVCLKQSKDIKENAEIVVIKRREFVSRGGEKLQGALLHVYHNTHAVHQFCHNKRALDIGSSTGGFSDCLLTYGVNRIDAVDVGTSQLHSKLRDDSRISLYENTDIRNFTSKEKYSIIVADVSFISLSAIFERIVYFCTSGTTIFLLIKPQFEVGKEYLTKSGIVKNEKAVDLALREVRTVLMKEGCTIVGKIESPILGGSGNTEYLFYVRRQNGITE
jgi:23S rRNA (cytidine1920-2'-O)/16S rRNA (cytidine1409-2'-O)-methyltransferase